MALAQYVDKFWFPDGTLAGGVTARVFLRTTNVLATLWQDSAGTVPLANPTRTSAGGVLTFWAEEGTYWLHLDSESFEITVPASASGPFLPLAGGTLTGPLLMTGGGVDIDVQQSVSTAVSTGVISGGHMTVNAGDPSSVDIDATVGYIVDYVTDPANPTVTRLTVAAQTVALTDIVSTVTYWLIDSAGTVVQQSTVPTNAQRRTHVELGRTAQSAGTIFEIRPRPTILPQPSNQLGDLMDALGFFLVSGNTISANGSNLAINTTGGTLFARGTEYTSTPNDPHIGVVDAASPAQHRRGLRNTTNFGAPVAVIDPVNWDNGGVLTAVGGGTNRSTVQRVYAFSSADQPDQMVVLYGQAVYNDLNAAVAGAATEAFVTNPQIAVNGVLVAMIAVQRTATDLSDPAQARFIQVGKFGGGGTATSATGTDTVGATRTAYKTADESVTNSTAMQDDDHLLMSVSADGVYTIDMYLDVEADTAADIMIGFTFPAGALISWTEGGISLGNGNNIGNIKLQRNTGATTSSVGILTNALGGSAVMPRGSLRVGGTAGNLQFQWAQNALSATPTVLKAGSWLRITRIA